MTTSAATQTGSSRMQYSSWMSEEHIQLSEMVGRFIAAEVAPNIARWRKQGVVDRHLWIKAGNLGLLGGALPETYGGSGGDYGHELVVLYEQARAGDSGWGLSVHYIVLHYILNCGTEEQKRRWLPGLISGEQVGAIAMTEPGTGSDLKAIRASATKDGDHYIVDGSKTFVSNGQLANLIIVVVKTNSAIGAKGMSLLVVEADTAEGLRRGRNLDKLGVKAQDTSELFFDGLRVPLWNVLGGIEGQGFCQLMNELAYERLIFGVTGLGASELALSETIRYVRERRVFGKPVSDYQNTRFKLAECKTKIEVMRTFVDRSIQSLLAGRLDSVNASMVKYWCSETQGEIIDDCLQLFGGYGYMLEYTVANLYADARLARIAGGTSEIQREIIAKSLFTD